MSQGVGIHAPMVTRVGVWASAAIASPVMRSSVLVLIGVRAATRSVVLKVGDEAEYTI